MTYESMPDIFRERYRKVNPILHISIVSCRGMCSWYKGQEGKTYTAIAEDSEWYVPGEQEDYNGGNGLKIIRKTDCKVTREEDIPNPHFNIREVL